jgi:hypothetical protein
MVGLTVALIGLIVPVVLSAADTKFKTMKIHFIPFLVETYVPVTMSDIESSSHVVLWFTQSHIFMNDLRRVLTARRASRSIDDRVIRLKVELDTETFFVDKDGVVFEPSTGASFRLTSDDLSDVQKRILYFSGVVDIKASERLRGPR